MTGRHRNPDRHVDVVDALAVLLLILTTLTALVAAIPLSEVAR